MKTWFFLVGFMMLCISCINKDENNVPSDFTRSANDSTRTYSDLNGTSLTLTNTTWFTTNVNGFGTVYLVSSGSTTADKVTVRNYGDGVISDEELTLDTNKKFSKDTLAISFTHFSGVAPGDSFERSTVVKACKGSDTIVVTITSGLLKY